MKISQAINHLWHETEEIVTQSAGPLLIASSVIRTADVFSGGIVSDQFPYLSLVLAIAMAVGVNIWLGVSFGYAIESWKRGKSGFWWSLLAGVLFCVDVQTASLFAVHSAHISALGEWGWLQIPVIDWVIEIAVLGVVLIAVHRAVLHAEPTPKVLATVYNSPTEYPQPVTGQPPVAVVDPLPAITLRAPYRRDVGRQSENRKVNVAKVLSMIEKAPDHLVRITDVEKALGVTRQTATGYIASARDLYDLHRQQTRSDV